MMVGKISSKYAYNIIFAYYLMEMSEESDMYDYLSEDDLAKIAKSLIKLNPSIAKEAKEDAEEYLE